MESDRGFMATKPGVMLVDIVVQKNRKGRCSVPDMNNTNKTVSLKKGCVIGKSETLDDVHAFTVGSVTTGSKRAKEKNKKTPD